MAAALLAALEEPDDEGAVLLEEEDVARLLLVHVAADHAQGRLVEPGVAVRLRTRFAAAGERLVHEPGDVVVEEGERLLGLRAERLGPGAVAAARGDDALDDEAIGRFDEEDLAHAALIDERTDRAEDLLEVLARTALVDAHQASLVGRAGRRPRRAAGSMVRSRWSGRAVRDPSRVGRSPGRPPPRRV